MYLKMQMYTKSYNLSTSQSQTCSGAGWLDFNRFLFAFYIFTISQFYNWIVRAKSECKQLSGSNVAFDKFDI